MGTEILKSYGLLQSELEQAKTSLKGVDENIKRLIGRDPSEIIPRSGIKRGPSTEENNRGGKVRVVGPGSRNRNYSNHDNDEPIVNKRRSSVFNRLSERPSHYEEEIIQQPPKQLISKVIVTPREVPSRLEALAAQNRDEKSKARNKRMFGALLGTLQKFQQEETKLKSKEEKRAQLEKKIEETEIREKAEIKKERQELFFNRKKKQAEIKMIELKMLRMKEYAIWEERQKPCANFILTKAKPQICYLPRKLNDASKTLLEASKGDVEKQIEKRKQEVFQELQHIEDRMKKNFEARRQLQQHKNDVPINEDQEQQDDDVEREIMEELHDHGLNEQTKEETEQSEMDINPPNVDEKIEHNEELPTNSEEGVENGDFSNKILDSQAIGEIRESGNDLGMEAVQENETFNNVSDLQTLENDEMGACD